MSEVESRSTPKATATTATTTAAAAAILNQRCARRYVGVHALVGGSPTYLRVVPRAWQVANTRRRGTLNGSIAVLSAKCQIRGGKHFKGE